jgi:DNA-binding transcriptional regulator YiaG
MNRYVYILNIKTYRRTNIMKGNLKTFQSFKTEYLADSDPDAVKEYEIALLEFKIADQLKELRKGLNLSQRDFAKRLNKPQSTVARVENGSMSPTVGLLEEIAKCSNKELKIEFVSR